MDFALSILGSSAATPFAQRFTTAQVLHVHGQLFLIDCGEGCQMRLQQYVGRFGQIRHIFISHLHGDHIFGLPGLITSFALNQRSEALVIHSPPGLEDLIRPLVELGHPLPYDLIFAPHDTAQPSLIFENNNLTVSTLPLRHRVPTAGFLFREKAFPPRLRKSAVERHRLSVAQIKAALAAEPVLRPNGEAIPSSALLLPPARPRSYAFCSDTRYFPELAAEVEGVDLLYHEATFLHSELARAELTMHTTAREAAELARSAKAKRLLLGHISARYADTLALAAEAQAIFPDSTVVEDGQRFDVPFDARADEED